MAPDIEHISRIELGSDNKSCATAVALKKLFQDSVVSMGGNGNYGLDFVKEKEISLNSAAQAINKLGIDPKDVTFHVKGTINMASLLSRKPF